MLNPLHIAEGYYRQAQEALGVLPDNIKEFATRRYAMCLACEEFNHEYKTCGLCQCPMQRKTKVALAYCPQGLWKEENENTSVRSDLHEKASQDDGA